MSNRSRNLIDKRFIKNIPVDIGDYKPLSVAAVRTYGVTYTNTTNSAIYVSVSLYAQPSADYKLYVDGVLVATSAMIASGRFVNLRWPMGAIVPIGSNYMVTVGAGYTVPTEVTWVEYRNTL